ncbi:MAG: dTDP-4-dehydrorhamnose 3,5-epimerase [Sutterella sp.]|nr:dTDP-4-dehydrorhamnose 3,5-epimerase [Sutterella sp.]
MPISIIDTKLPDVKLIQPRVFPDERGYFFEAFNARDFAPVAQHIQFVQDNQSQSAKGVVRGLHYQLPPFAQAKLVRCLSGAIFDVAVDIRRSSPTFGQWVSAVLSAENKHQLWIPEGFAHGFVALTDTAEVFYKTNAHWNKAAEASIRWDDPTLAIEWPIEVQPTLSPKDALAPFLPNAQLFE